MDQTLTGATVRTALDVSQLGAVEVLPGTRQIVIAGPGSGKTEVVSALVEHLVVDEGADPTDGVAVISFSNAAVHAVDARLRARGAGPVAVQTMDSLAADVLRDLATEDTDGLGFDDRIQLAARLLTGGQWDRIADLEHLVVDEVQDVVGVRADFLLVILSCLPMKAGFTLLGDPAQGIYDFQLRADRWGRPARSATTCAQFIDAVADRFGVDTRVLTGQYRAEGRDARRAAALRSAALPDGDPDDLQDFYDDLVPFSTVDDVHDVARTWPGTTAFLTDTNGQALLVAGALRNRGAMVEIRRSARQRVVAQWVASLLGDHPRDSVTRAEFDDLVAERAPYRDAPALWRALRGAVGGRGAEVNLAALGRQLHSTRPLVPELVDQGSGRLVVSTVHRAKGLEFDNVVIVASPRPALAEPSDGYVAPSAREALRTRFVALTRARRHIVRAVGPDDRWLRLLRDRGLDATRWYVGGHKPSITSAYEIGVADVEPVLEVSSEPELGDLSHSVASSRSQAHLATQVASSDPLELRLDPDRSTLAAPVYNVLHEGVPIARTTAMFGEDLAVRIGTIEKARRSWPELSGARIEGVTTRVVDPVPGRRNGLLLAPTITGLLDLHWETRDPT